jgi:hypothetical protein
MAQLTSLEWLMDKLKFIDKNAYNELYEYYEQAKEMQKEQIVNAHLDGQSLVSCKDEYGEKYYNETYNN